MALEVLRLPTRGYRCLYSPSCREKLFGKSEWAPLWVSYESAKRGAKRPYRHFVLPKTHDPGLSSYFPNSFLEEVTDPGQSGASLERPGMDRVRDLVAEGGVSVVLAQDRDRFAREPAYHYLLRQEFEERGCKLRALNDHGDGSPEGELTDGIFDQLAKYERAKTAERTRRGKLRKAREGKH